jgi:hypothetical protein
MFLLENIEYQLNLDSAVKVGGDHRFERSAVLLPLWFGLHWSDHFLADQTRETIT